MASHRRARDVVASFESFQIRENCLPGSLQVGGDSAGRNQSAVVDDCGLPVIIRRDVRHKPEVFPYARAHVPPMAQQVFRDQQHTPLYFSPTRPAFYSSCSRTALHATVCSMSSTQNWWRRSRKPLACCTVGSPRRGDGITSSQESSVRTRASSEQAMVCSRTPSN